MRVTSKNESCKLGIDLGGYVATPILPARHGDASGVFGAALL